MRLSPQRKWMTVVLSATGLLSLRAMPEWRQQQYLDTNAFNTNWSGNYYVESEEDFVEEEEEKRFKTFEEKSRYYLESDTIGQEEFDIVGSDEQNPGPQGPGDPPEQGPINTPSILGFPIAPLPSPTPSPSRSGPPIYPPQYEIFFPWLRPPEKPPAMEPEVIVGPRLPEKPQSYYYYNRGSLKYASQLETEGKGFVKIFVDRDLSIGGRGWGTNLMIGSIRQIAAEFANAFPGRERLQVGDIARKAGGPASHASHQNGLEADIVFFRKNRREQGPRDNFGKNGFSEQFKVVASKKYVTKKNSKGVPYKKLIVTYKLSDNFDTEANFELMMLWERSPYFLRAFVDDLVIREFVRYAKETGRYEEPAFQSLFKKLMHFHNHADHFHIRLACQETDKKCYSQIAPRYVKPKPVTKTATSTPVKAS